MVIADALEASGLKAAGYSAINSDCGWQSNKHGRDADGRPTADMANISGTAATLHQRGFTMGLCEYAAEFLVLAGQCDSSPLFGGCDEALWLTGCVPL
jgi:hypothetical protein